MCKFCLFLKNLNVVRTKHFKNRVTPRWEKYAWFFCFFFRAGQTSGDIWLGCTRSSGYHCASHKINPVTPKSLLKAPFFWKKLIFPWKNVFMHSFFFLLSNMTVAKEQFLSVQKVFWQLLGKLKGQFFGTEEVDRKNSPRRKAMIPVKKKFYARFYCKYRQW